jgi:3',5'-nucleoside bisphosphate phosphatase
MICDIDLHSHTNASDGSCTPAELISKAKKAKINLLAITDHDTIDGVEEGIHAGVVQGVHVIPGAEISVDNPFSPSMHICCYNININNNTLQEALKHVQNAREERNPKIIKNLNQQGIAITIDEVKKIAGNGQTGRPHIAKAMLQKGYIENMAEAFDKYLANDAPCYVQKERLSLADAIEIVRQAGGITVLAHPGTIKTDHAQDYKNIFAELKNMGISGIEAYSSHHTPEENKLFFNIATELNMMITGGSDYHGANHPHISLGCFGADHTFPVNKLKTEFQKQSINI